MFIIVSLKIETCLLTSILERLFSQPNNSIPRLIGSVYLLVDSATLIARKVAVKNSKVEYCEDKLMVTIWMQ